MFGREVSRYWNSGLESVLVGMIEFLQTHGFWDPEFSKHIKTQGFGHRKAKSVKAYGMGPRRPNHTEN